MPKQLIKNYPDADTYQGECFKGHLEFYTTRFPFIDSVINWILTNAIEYGVQKKGGRLLRVEIYAIEDSWHGIPAYRWKVTFYFYVVAIAWQTVALEILKYVAIIVVSIALAYIVKKLEVGTWFRNIFQPGKDNPIYTWFRGFGEMAYNVGVAILLGGAGILLLYYGLSRMKEKQKT